MPAIQHDTAAPDTRQLIREATAWALEHGHAVITSQDRGVVRVSSEFPRWAPDPRRGKRINPVGAAILKEQPDTDDVDRAAIESLHTSKGWIDAYEVGLSGQLPLCGWKSSPCELVMADGYLAGAETRAAMGIRAQRARAEAEARR
jgi:hypothetical protein